MIFSWHPEDPDDEQSVMYHGASRRGSASLNLLGGLTSPPKIPNDAQSFDILADNVGSCEQKCSNLILRACHVILLRLQSLLLTQHIGVKLLDLMKDCFKNRTTF